MTSLARLDDLADVPGLEDLDEHTDEELQKALDMATSAIVAELGWDPFLAERTLTLRPTLTGEPIILPALNVAEIEVTADGTVLDEDLLDWTTPGSVIYLRSGRVLRGGSVTYTAGWDPGTDPAPSEIPQALIDACCDLAVALLDNPRRLRVWRAGEATETYAEIGRPDDRRLDKYRLPPAIS